MTPINEMRIAQGLKPMGRPVGSGSRTNAEIYSDRRLTKAQRAAKVAQNEALRAVKAAAKEKPEPPAHERLASQLAQMLSRWNRMLAKDCERDPLDRLPA